MLNPNNKINNSLADWNRILQINIQLPQYIKLWLHLLVESINCWFWSHHKTCSQKEKSRISLALSFNLATAIISIFHTGNLPCLSRKSTGITNNINNGSVLFKCTSKTVSHDSVTVRQHEQYHNPETEAATWNSAIIHFIIYTCTFPDMSCLPWKTPM